MKHNFFRKRVVIVIFSISNIFISNISDFYSKMVEKYEFYRKSSKHKITLTILFRLFYLNYEYEHTYTYKVTNTCFILKCI